MQDQLGGAGPDGGRRERHEAEESIKLLHRKAAALAWYRHARRGSSAGGGRSSSRLQLHSLSPVPAAAAGKQLSIRQPQDPDPFKVSGLHIPAAVGAPDCGSALPSLPPVHQPSRFKAEALSRAAALQPSLSVIDATSAAPNKQIMSAGQSLALLSLLPQHQSQKCFQSKKDGGSSATPWDCGSSLYDSFELLSLSNQLGRCLTTVHAAAAAASSPSSSPHHKLLKNAPPPPPPLPPPPRTLPPAYIPRSLYALPQFILPNYLATKSSRKRSPLIHPIFSTPNNAPSAHIASLPPPPPSHHHPPDKASKHKASGSGVGGGFRRVFNSLLKTLHIKESPEPPRRSNLSDELKKLPGRPRSTPCTKDSPPLNGRPRAEAEAPPKMKDSHAHHHVHHHHHHHHHFRNEGFRTTSKAPKTVKWAQPGAF